MNTTFVEIFRISFQKTILELNVLEHLEVKTEVLLLSQSKIRTETADRADDTNK
jgi:hypothetical protein